MIMASSSSSAANPQVKHHVFLSFRGKDTRNNFTSHLDAALRRKQIKTFIDDQLVRGEEISSSLLDKIKASKVSIIVFSENYADSRWCLQELEHILKCKRTYGQIVIPVFYRVDPSHVRNQTAAFGEAFGRLRARFAQRLDELQRWKAALEEAANLSGHTSNDEKPESEVIDATVGDILKRLCKLSPSKNKGLVGLESKVQTIESLLRNKLNDIGIIGIWGIGGIGKTTIAQAVYNKISSDFEGSFFVENVREAWEKNSELTYLRQELFSAILEDGQSNIRHSFTEERLGSKKVLIVFHDLTCFQQLKKLIGDLNCLGVGSQIIITSRNKQVLKNCGVDVANIYELRGLCDDDALELFSMHAFRQKHPFEDYMELSKKIVRYTRGIPLALEVLGSCLLDRTKQVWESQIKELDNAPHQFLQKVLQISYDGLAPNERNIFLDIAFFFKGWKSCLVEDILDARGFSTRIGLINLIDKSLITISNEVINMHDLLQEMAKEIVKQESTDDPGKRIRLWNHEDIYRLLKKNTGTEAIQGMFLEMSKMRDVTLDPYAFAKMPNLRVFQVYGSNYGENKLHGFKALKSFSSELTCFGWNGYPMKSLPLSFHAENLVSLDMPHSKVKRLWNGVQRLFKLKHINLSHSEFLRTIPNLSNATNLQELNLEGCTRLCKIDPSSVQNLQKLVELNLKDCRRLRRLPTGINSKYLKDVILSGCSNLKKIPKLPCNVERIFLEGTAIKELPLIEYPSRLHSLYLENCKRLKSLPDNFCQLKCLRQLFMNGCSNLERLPEDLGNLNNLVVLNLSEVESLGAVLPPLSGLSALVRLHLNGCGITKLPECLGRLSSLEELYLRRNEFESIPVSIKDLYNLRHLYLSHCESLQSLPILPLGVSTIAGCCSSLKSISDLSFLFSSMRGIQGFDLINCYQLDQNELGNIMKESLLGLSRKLLYLRSIASICFPGYDIPEWFSFRSTGSKFLVDLQPGWFNNNFLGFAMCAVIEIPDNHYFEDQRIRCICITKSEGGEKKKSIGYLRLYGTVGEEVDTVGTDHVLLGYDFGAQDPVNVFDPRDYHYVDLNFNNKASFEFYVEDFGGLRIDSCEVKKCGVHLLYASDGGEATEGTGRSFNTIEVVEVEDDEEPDCVDPMVLEGTSGGVNPVEVVEVEGVGDGEGPDSWGLMLLEGTSRSFNPVEVVEVEGVRDGEEPQCGEPMVLEGTSRSFNPVEVVELEDEDEEPHPKRLKYYHFL